ncbi:MAG: DUF3619 family protein [Betaproteobacteria bacterium]|nr:DUF3619 family protein [Betaproteobacteria bacterium]
MSDDDTLARKICAHLGRQPKVPARIAYRLSDARAHALMRLATPQPTWVRLLQSRTLRLGAIIGLSVLVFAYATRSPYYPESNLVEIDARLLSGELPPEAYLDPGFVRFVSEKGER